MNKNQKNLADWAVESRKEFSKAANRMQSLLEGVFKTAFIYEDDIHPIIAHKKLRGRTWIFLLLEDK